MNRNNFHGIIFDDVVFDDDNTAWSQICENCRSKYELTGNGEQYSIDYAVGNGICGVEGCNNKSNHYIDFGNDELIEIQ